MDKYEINPESETWLIVLSMQRKCNPRKGKNIKVSAAGGGERWNEVLEWDGYQFNSKVVP